MRVKRSTVKNIVESIIKGIAEMNKEEKNEILMDGSKLWYQDSTWQIYEATTYEAAKILAGSKMGRDKTIGKGYRITLFLQHPPFLIIKKDNKFFAMLPVTVGVLDIDGECLRDIPADLDDAIIKFIKVYPNKKRLLGLPLAIGHRILYLELFILQESPDTIYEYARFVIKHRWPAGEPAISKDASASLNYAMNVLHDRFPAGEKEIIAANKAWYIYNYALKAIHGRWPAGESVIAKDAMCAYNYAVDIIKGRFLKGESTINKDSRIAHKYKEEFGLE